MAIPTPRKLAPLCLLGSALISTIVLTGCKDSSEGGSTADGKAPPTGQAPEVGYVVVRSQPIELSTNVAGRVVAYNTAEIRPQVGGIVKERVFKEGAEVKPGDILYRLDPQSYEAAVASAEATLKKNEAAVSSAKFKYDRYQGLAKTTAVSQQDRDDAESSYLQALADVAAAQADLQTAKINLGHTAISAPIGGQIGRSSVSVGSLVTASQTDALATIRQIDPVFVDLTESSGNLIKFRNQLEKRGFTIAVGTEEPQAEVKLTFTDGTPYEGVGRIESADQFVVTTTSTFTIRSRFDNPKRHLLPGMYLLGTIGLAKDNKGFLLPQRAVSRDADGKASARFVKPDGTAETRTIEATVDIGPNWLVTNGVSDGDRLIVDGLQNIQDGKPVRPVEVKMGTNGLVLPTSGNSDNDGAKAMPATK